MVVGARIPVHGLEVDVHRSGGTASAPCTQPCGSPGDVAPQRTTVAGGDDLWDVPAPIAPTSPGFGDRDGRSPMSFGHHTAS
jgi:hypothetical protein